MLSTPPAFAAVERYPTLARPVARSLAAQQRRVTLQLGRMISRPELVAEFDTLLGEIDTGFLLLEGPAGAGATTLLCQIAMQRSAPLWLPADDVGDGLAALCAQIIALHDLPIPLVPPNADRDAETLERLLTEAVAQRAATDPLVLLIDAMPDTHCVANPLPFPQHVPPGVVIVSTSLPDQQAQIEPVARLRLPSSGPVLIRSLVDIAMGSGLPRATAAAIAAHSGRSLLYVSLASGLLQNGVIRRRHLPEGMQALHNEWWDFIGDDGHRIAAALAAATNAVPLDDLQVIAGVSADLLNDQLSQWGPLIEASNGLAGLAHDATRAFIHQQLGGSLGAIHNAYVRLARERLGAQLDRPVTDDVYLVRATARHIALGTPETRGERASRLVSRTWPLAQERRTGDLHQAACDAAWAVRVAAEDHDLDLLLRSAVVAGTLASLGRKLSPEAVAEALVASLERGEPRDAALRRTRQLVDQLPDGINKALVLRRIGEVCFERGMRAQAMRMLAEALDFEVPGLPRTWHDEREEAQVALARVAIAAGMPDRALGITVRISHPERRGLIETDVVRWLISASKLTRAEEVAHAIGHEHTHEWAMAEVAAAHARAGNMRRFREVLGTLRTETAIAWARTELACDAARRGDTSAVEQVAVIASDNLRDQALGLVVRALVVGNQAPSALIAARQIADPEVRTRTLIDFAQMGVRNASSALSRAGETLRELEDDVRTPLTVLLATAYATVGDLDSALRVANQLSGEEERDRAYSRVAAALARRGELAHAEQVAASIPDDDERGWTQHELARARAEAGQWHEASALVALIVDDEQRTRARADVRIARGRAGQLDSALSALESLPADERSRVLQALAPMLAAHKRDDLIEPVRAMLTEPRAQSRFALALATAQALHGDTETAVAEARAITRPLDRSRALIACARGDKEHAADLLGEALRLASSLGRSEVLTALLAAAELLVSLDGADLLLSVAHALDEVDGWWG